MNQALLYNQGRRPVVHKEPINQPRLQNGKSKYQVLVHMGLIGKENSSCKQKVLSAPFCMVKNKFHDKALEALKNIEKC